MARAAFRLLAAPILLLCAAAYLCAAAPSSPVPGDAAAALAVPARAGQQAQHASGGPSASGAKAKPPQQAAQQQRVQLDACNHFRTQGPGMTLEVKEGVCTVTSRALSGPPAAGRCAAAPATPALALSFACNESSETRPSLSGPALNLWAAAPLAGAAAGAGGRCALTTLSPPMYYKMRAPPALYYGYAIAGIPCGRPAAGAGALSGGDGLMASPGEGGGRMAASYGLWVAPSLPSPAQGGPPEQFKTTGQQCRLSVTAVGRAYLSTASFPCAMVVNPEKSLGGGCCFGSPEYHDLANP